MDLSHAIERAMEHGHKVTIKTNLSNEELRRRLSMVNLADCRVYKDGRDGKEITIRRKERDETTVTADKR